MNESVVQGEILRVYANHPRVCLWRQSTGAARIGGRFIRFGLKGQADLQGVTEGRALFIECKSERGVQSPEQKTFQRLVERHGGIYILARTLADVSSALGF